MNAKLLQIALAPCARARRVVAGRAPALRRGLSGTAPGVVRGGPRRGSFLIMVVGVLALLSVVAVLYATIGAADRNRGAALVRADQSDAVPAAMRDYIAGVVGDSALNVFPERAANGDYVFLRQTWDYPWMDWTTKATYSAGDDIAPFSPTGMPARYWPPAGPAVEVSPAQWVRDQQVIWRPSSPWLASAEPTALHPEAAPPTDPEYTKRRDWLKITNISPKGRFVNLANLRGRFEANEATLASNLWLLDDRGNPTNRLVDWGASVGSGIPADVPAYWTQRQRDAFAPVGYNPRNIPASNSRLLANMWGDADGDGMYDSRWAALDASWGEAFASLSRDTRYKYFVAARVIDAGALLNVNFATDQSPWQTAGGSLAGPAPDRPVGCSPAEIDLRRALTLRDQYDRWNLGPGANQSRGYDFALGTFSANLDYSDYTRGVADEVGHWAYISLRLALATGVTPPRYNTLDADPTSAPFSGPLLGRTGGGNPSFADLAGVSAADKARLWDFEVLDGTVQAGPNGYEGLTAPEARSRYYAARAAADNASAWLTAQVLAPPAGANPFPTIDPRVLRESQGWFGVEDAIELFTYRGQNNPDRLSPLEATLGGRDNPNPTARPAHLDYSPLLDNLPLEAQRSGATNDPLLFSAVNLRQRLTPYSGARELFTGAGIAEASTDHLSAGEIRLDAPALLAAAARAPVLRPMDPHHQTDTSFNAIFKGYLGALAPSIAEGNTPGLRQTPSTRSFCWQDNNNPAPSGARTLCYGYQGPELAYMLSAFLSVNILDSYDSDLARVDPAGLGRVERGVPQARTVLIDDALRQALDADSQLLPAEGRRFPWWHAGRDIDANPRDARAARSGGDAAFKMADTAAGDSVNARAINVFGNEAQPFVTAVTGFTVYTDARTSGAVNGFGATDDEASIPTDATIDGTIAYPNRDLIMRVFAVQLTNPYNVAIQLGAHELDPDHEQKPGEVSLRNVDPGNPTHPGFDRMKDYYYLDFAGRTYALVHLQEQHLYAGSLPPDAIDMGARPIVVPAGESIVVYATSTLPQDIMVNRLGWLDQANMGTTLTTPDPWFGSTDYAHSPYQFHQLIRKHIADRAHGIGRWAPVTAREGGLYLIPEIYSPKAFPTQATDLARLGKMAWSTWDSANSRTATQSYEELQSAGRRPFSDLFDPADLTKTRVVKLWRALRCGPGTPAAASADDVRLGDTQKAADSLFVHNLRSNDLLVDRFRLPTTTPGASGPTDYPDYYTDLDVRLPAGQNSISGGAPDDGLTITLWDSAHRPSDPDASFTGTGLFSGMLPSYCLERKLSLTPGSDVRSWNAPAPASNADPVGPTTYRFQTMSAAGLNVPDASVFGSVPGAEDTVWDWFRGISLGAARTAVVPGVAIAPSYRNQAQNPDPVATYPDHDWSIDQARWRNANFAGGIIKPAFVADRPEAALDADNFIPHRDMATSISTAGGPMTVFERTPFGQTYLRSTDMLSTLAVCAFQDPAYGPGSTLPLGNWSTLPMLSMEDAEWTTLSEALVLAMGYERAPRPSVPMACRTLYPVNSTDPNNPFNPAGPRRPLFDHGCLRLDDFVPYNRSANAGDPHVARGTQMPLAWNVIDVFRVRDSRAPKPNTALDPRDPPLTHSVPGVLNLNTAPLENQRMVPLLTPPLAATDSLLGWGIGRPAWWWATDLSKGGLSPASDIAATVVALRDKVGLANFRPQSDPGLPVTFRERDNAGNETPPFDAAALPAAAYDALSGRRTSTQIPDLGEFPGFRSPAAILAARFQDPTDPTTKALLCNIDHFGFNQTATGTPVPANNSLSGVTPHTFRVWDLSHTPLPAWVDWENRAPNDYSEKLAVAAGALGSISTRSDVFVAWFLLHGYQRGDVEGLEPNDPMVPSVKRRFMMVLDRSNVRQRGDKPKVLVFQEVPVD